MNAKGDAIEKGKSNIDDKILIYWIIKAFYKIKPEEIIKTFDDCGLISEEGRNKAINERLVVFLKYLDRINDYGCKENIGKENENISDSTAENSERNIEDLNILKCEAEKEIIPFSKKNLP